MYFVKKCICVYLHIIYIYIYYIYIYIYQINNEGNKLMKIKFVSVFVFTSLIFHYLRSLSSLSFE